MRRTILLCAFLSAAAPGVARPGVFIETATRDSRRADAPLVHGRIWIDGPKLRLESVGGSPGAGSDAETVAIFRGDRELLWSLDPDGVHYAAIDRKTLDRLAETRRSMATRLEALPPEQRTALERMMGEHTPPPPEAPLELDTSAGKGEVDGRACRSISLRRGGEEAGSVCVVDFGEVGLSRRELRVFRSLARFQRSLLELAGAAPGGDLARQPFEVFDRLGGFPLRTQRIEGGRVASETLFTRVEPAEPDASLFELPEGALPREAPFLAPALPPPPPDGVPTGPPYSPGGSS